MTIFFQLVAERIEGINLKNEGNEALVAGRAIHELNGLKRNEMSECGSLPPTIGEMEWKQWTQRENFSFWVEFMRQWNGAPLAGGCLSFHLFVGYGPAAPLRSSIPLHESKTFTPLQLLCLSALLPRRRQAALLCLFCFIEDSWRRSEVGGMLWWLGPKPITNYRGIWIGESNSIKRAAKGKQFQHFTPQIKK